MQESASAAFLQINQSCAWPDCLRAKDADADADAEADAAADAAGLDTG